MTKSELLAVLDGIGDEGGVVICMDTHGDEWGKVRGVRMSGDKIAIIFEILPLKKRECADEIRKNCANILNVSRSEASLMAGEMTAQEWRTVRAILKALQARMRSESDSETINP